MFLAKKNIDAEYFYAINVFSLRLIMSALLPHLLRSHLVAVPHKILLQTVD